MLEKRWEGRERLPVAVANVLLRVVTLPFRTEDALHLRVVIEERKKDGDAFNDGGAQFGLDPLPVLIEPATHGVELLEFVRVGMSRIENAQRLGGNPLGPHEFPQLGRRFGHVSVFLWFMLETEAGEVGGPCAKHFRSEGDKVPSHDDVFGFENPLLKKWRRDGALVDIEEPYVVVGNLMEANDEIDEVGVSLFDKRF